MLRLSPLALLGTCTLTSSAKTYDSLDDTSMLQMPVIEQGLSTDADASECRCPGYYKEECDAEWAQGCIWTDSGSSNAPWCQCGPIPTDPLTGEPVTVSPPLEITTLAPTVESYSYIGCFTDDGSRDLQEGPRQYGYNSQSCHEACGDYSFFSLQHGGWCACGNAYATGTQYYQVDDGQCGSVCVGEDALCGGSLKNAVYSNGPIPTDPLTGEPVTVSPPLEITTLAPTVESYSYIGCFTDDGHRDLQEGPRQYGYNSQSCHEACGDYSFFSLQHNGWCACGNAYATRTQYYQVDDGQCGSVCAGEDELCGGSWRNAVYSTR